VRSQWGDGARQSGVIGAGHFWMAGDAIFCAMRMSVSSSHRLTLLAKMNGPSGKSLEQPLDFWGLTNYKNRQSSFSGLKPVMNIQVKTKPEDTRARIMDSAEALFRRLGFAKTAVADIAAELGMSPANVYRFFPSKNAIVEAICRRCLSEVENRAWSVARSKAPAAQRLERLILEILAYHKENLIGGERVHDMVLAAIEHSWEAIHAHKEALCAVTELILRDGIEAGEFEPVEPHETADLILRSVVLFTHPVMVAQCMQDSHDIDADARGTVRFLLRAITRR
jgi:AcrR family transcriptional regulator